MKVGGLSADSCMTGAPCSPRTMQRPALVTHATIQLPNGTQMQGKCYKCIIAIGSNSKVVVLGICLLASNTYPRQLCSLDVYVPMVSLVEPLWSWQPDPASNTPVVNDRRAIPLRLTLSPSSRSATLRASQIQKDQ
jgi:hypothetical protein